MRLVVGLGNPGLRYKNNRHNIGFLALDNFSKLKKLKFGNKKLYRATQAENLELLKPKTYMNRSGDALTSIMTNHQFDDILVVVDDVNLPFGKIRLREKGSAGGHNGLKSIIQSLGTDDFKRLRIGVGNSLEGDLADYVLSNFKKEEKQKFDTIFSFVNELLSEYNEFGFKGMSKKFNFSNKSYSDKMSGSRGDQNGTKKSPKEEIC